MLEAEGISFSWGSAPLLRDISFSVSPGETVVIAGANGSGKTTLIKILSGIVVPAAGFVRTDGMDAFRHPLRFRRQLGYLSENLAADDDLTVAEFLRYRAQLKGEASRRIRHRVTEAMELCGVTALADASIGTLSRGQRKRAALADALMLRPRLLLLDDLLAGLDIETRCDMKRILSAGSSFAAIVASGHELEDFASFASRFLVLKGGVLLSSKTAAGARNVIMHVTPGEKVSG